MNEGNMSKIIGVLIALAIVLGGVFFFMSSSDDDDSEDAATTSQEAEDESSEIDGDEGASANIVELAVATDSLSTLVQAVTAADLADTLADESAEFTVFTPTNDAFAALPEGTLDDLLMPENVDQLTSVLTYHVVPSAAMAADLSDGMMLETVNGEMLEVSIVDGVVSVGGATVVTADIEASNGVVHVIDAVLLP